ncbi:MAG: hypothetical protein QGE94_10325, partial [Desulfobacterales bacterium]|nr:hypothetical protein [Desulfobacterales bacterium]
MKKYLTRRGDGTFTEMTADELMQDFEIGPEDAADRGKISPLPKDDLDHWQDIITNPNKFISVEPRKEVPLTHDIGTLRLMRD